MRGPRVVTVAQKKPDSEMLKKRKAKESVKKERVNKKTSKDSDAPKRPPTAFFVFMEDFRKSFKENCPDNRSVSAVGKAGGEKWKSMSESERDKYIKIALTRKTEYEKAFEAYKNKLNSNVNVIEEKAENSEKSTSEVQDEEAGQEETSSFQFRLGAIV